MSAPHSQMQLTDDKEATSLLVKINQHIVARDLILDEIKELEKKVQYRNRCIRELAVKRSEALNFKLPL